MTSRRTAKVARAIQEAISSAVLHGLKDPRVQNVTVLSVDVADDIRNAKVYVSVMGTDKQQALCMRGLSSARGFLQAKVAERLQTKQTPILTFVLDQSVKRSLAASALIREAMAHDQSPEGTEHSDDTPPEALEPQTPDAADDPLDDEA